MNIIEVKNNLVKLCYEDELVLSGLIQINDNNKSYIAQVLHLEAARIGKIAIAKIIFNYNNGISAYDGSIPSLRAELKPADSSILLDTLDKTDPLNLGKLAEQPHNIIVNIDILKDNPIIIAEKFFTTKVLLNNLALQLQGRKQKIVVFDTAGIFKTNKLTITKDFKLPLNNSTINYIYEKGFEDATAESKAMIQAIFEELGEYSKTVEFIPFDTFKAVVDSEFMRTRLIQLIILKNKIKQIRDWNVFAQNESEFNILKSKLESEETLVLDISCLKESLQKECIKYVYSILKTIKSEFYAFTPLSDENSDKFLLKQFLETENVHTTTLCNYDYKYLSELKKRSKNMLMFTPLKQQKDFGGYNIFLQKLAEDEFIAYGKMTKFVPLIGKLHQMSGTDIYIPKVNETLQKLTKEPEVPAYEIPTTEPAVFDEPVQQDSEPAVIEPAVLDEKPVQQDELIETEPAAETTEEIQEETTTEEIPAQAEEENPAKETEQVIETEEILPAEAEANKTEGNVQEETTAEVVEENDTGEETAIVETAAAVPVEEIAAPEAEIVETPEITEEKPEIQPETEVKQEVPEQNANETVAEAPVEPAPAIEPAQQMSEAEAALNEVPDIEDDEELSDDDLDMIEELSKPDEEIALINQQAQAEPPASAVTETPIQPANPEPAKEAAVPQSKNEDTAVTEAAPQAAEPAEVEQQAKQEAQPQPQPQPAQPQAPQEQKQESAPAQSADEEIKNAAMPASSPEPLQTRANTTPVVPVYPSDIPEEDKVRSDKIQQGDRVIHQDFGEGVVEKMINYGDKVLCSVNFASVGRRLLNPEISEMRKV